MSPLGTALLELPRWTAAGAVVWPRADFKCEYCGTSLIQDHGTYRWGTAYDHILPRSKYPCVYTEPATASWLPNTGTEYRNLALACCFCNLANYNFDPGCEIVSPETEDLLDDQRAAVIMRVRGHLGDRGRQLWDAALAEFAMFRQIVERS